MNKSILAALICIASTGAFANQPPEQNGQIEGKSNSKSIFVEYTKHEAKFAENIEVDLDGVAIGFSTSPQKSGISGKLEFLKSDLFNAEFVGGSVSGQLNFVNTERFYALGTLGLGYGVASADIFDSISYLTLPVGLELGLNLTKHTSLYGAVGYKWALDLSDEKTLCNDGYLSKNKGDSTCSSHYGVNRYFNFDYIGSFEGLTYGAGLRFNF